MSLAKFVAKLSPQRNIVDMSSHADISTPEQLFACDDREVWLATLERYADAIQKVSLKRGQNLIPLDHWYNHEAKASITSREPWSMTCSDLKQIMLWKITRGKFRPLMKLIESNSSESVREISSRSFEALKNRDFAAAMEVLTALKGVGVATASAVLSLLDPNEFPFMSDEALLTVLPTTKKDYSIRSYTFLKSKLKSKAEALGGSLSADDVGRALWIHTVMLADSQGRRSDVRSSAHGSTPPTKKLRR